MSDLQHRENMTGIQGGANIFLSGTTQGGLNDSGVVGEARRHSATSEYDINIESQLKRLIYFGPGINGGHIQFMTAMSTSVSATTIGR